MSEVLVVVVEGGDVTVVMCGGLGVLQRLAGVYHTGGAAGGAVPARVPLAHSSNRSAGAEKDAITSPHDRHLTPPHHAAAASLLPTDARAGAARCSARAGNDEQWSNFARRRAQLSAVHASITLSRCAAYFSILRARNVYI